MIPLVLTLVALLLAGIELVRSRATSLLAWAVVLLGVALIWGRL